MELRSAQQMELRTAQQMELRNRCNLLVHGVHCDHASAIHASENRHHVVPASPHAAPRPSLPAAPRPSLPAAPRPSLPAAPRPSLPASPRHDDHGGEALLVCRCSVQQTRVPSRLVVVVLKCSSSGKKRMCADLAEGFQQLRTSTKSWNRPSAVSSAESASNNGYPHTRRFGQRGIRLPSRSTRL